MVAPVVFFCIAFVFSMLGMGGAQLYIPALFWLGMDFKAEAIPLGLLLNVVNSSSAGITYLRERLVSWRVGLPFAAAMLPAVSFLAQTVPGADSQVFFYALPVGTATGGNSSPIGASANLMTFSTLWLFIRS